MRFFEGRYQRAERLAAEALALSTAQDAIAVNGLLAARSAHAMRDFARRDKHFADLKQKLGGPQKLALAMNMAELYLDERRYADADVAIAEARAISPKLTAAMRLELRLRQREDDPQAVLQLVDQLSRSEALDAAQASRIRVQAQLSLLSSVPMSLAELKVWWSKLSADDKQAPAIVLAMVDQLVAHDAPEDARRIIEEALALQWSPELVERYGRLHLPAEARVQQLQLAETWLHTRPNDYQLLLTLGRLCHARSLWGKAQNYLEACLAVEKKPHWRTPNWPACWNSSTATKKPRATTAQASNWRWATNPRGGARRSTHVYRQRKCVHRVGLDPPFKAEGRATTLCYATLDGGSRPTLCAAA